MMTEFAIEEQARQLQTLFNNAEIEINGSKMPVSLTSSREGSKVRFFIDVPHTIKGTITRRIIKNVNGLVCWADPIGSFSVQMPDTDLRTEIPIQITWKEEHL